MIGRPHAEEHIWRPIALRPELVGYPGAATLNHVQIGNQSGYVDLILLPVRGPKKLVLIEAKSTRDRRSSADVIGQLLKYYSHALDLAEEGLRALRKAALASENKRVSRLLSIRHVMKATSLLEAGALAGAGQRIQPDAIQLLVALDQNAGKLEPRLVKTAAVLSEGHQVPIGVVIVVDDNHVVWRYPESSGRADCAG